MKCKRAAVSLLLVCLLSVVPCFAAGALEVEFQTLGRTENKISFAVSSNVQNATLFVLKPGKTRTDLNKLTDFASEEAKAVLLYYKQLDLEGNTAVSFGVPANTATGSYTFLLTAKDGSSYEQMQYYVNPAEYAALVTNLVACQSASDVSAYFAGTAGIDNIKKLELETKYYDFIVEKTNIYEAIAALEGDTVTAQTIKDTFALSSVINYLGTVKDETGALEAIEEYHDKLSIDETVWKYYSGFPATNKKELYTIFSNESFADVSGFNGALAKSTALISIRAANWTEIKQALADFKTELEMTDADFNAIASAKNENTVYTELAGNMYTSISSFKTGLKDAISAANTSGSGGGGSISGGSSGGKGSISTGTIKGDPSEITPPDTDSEQSGRFSDVTNHWAKSAIETLAGKNVISGYPDGSFHPDETVTREQFVKMLAGVLKIALDSESVGFEDVGEDSWYFGYVNAAKKTGIVGGISENRFGTGMSITRQDACVMIYNAMKQFSYEVTPSTEMNFSDGAAVAGYAQEAVATLSGMKIVNGMEDGSFAPNGLLTRAQAAVLLQQLVK